MIRWSAPWSAEQKCQLLHKVGNNFRCLLKNRVTSTKKHQSPRGEAGMRGDSAHGPSQVRLHVASAGLRQRFRQQSPAALRSRFPLHRPCRCRSEGAGRIPRPGTWRHRQEMLTIEQPLGDGDGNRRVATGKRASAKLIRKIQHGQTNGHHVAQQTVDYKLHKLLSSFLS